jgi:hypothetical protein
MGMARLLIELYAALREWSVAKCSCQSFNENLACLSVRMPESKQLEPVFRERAALNGQRI